MWLGTPLWSLRSKPGRITSGVLLILFGASALWVVLTVAAPFMVPADTLVDLTGRVGMRENDAQFESLGLLPRTIYIIGDIECHQIADRSYFLNGNQMPFCARDLGLFVGLMVGFGIASFVSLQINPVLLILGLIPMGVDGGVQLVTEYESTNPLRMVTGIIAGAALALLLSVFVLALRDEMPKHRQRDSQVVESKASVNGADEGPGEGT
jgi:uncharacterized membrane protein